MPYLPDISTFLEMLARCHPTLFRISLSAVNILTHWDRVTHICVSKLTIIGSDNGWSPGWRQAIIWTNVGILLIGPLGTNFSDILIEILTVSFKKMRLKVSSAKWRPFCLGLNVLKCINVPYCFGTQDAKFLSMRHIDGLAQERRNSSALAI